MYIDHSILALRDHIFSCKNFARTRNWWIFIAPAIERTFSTSRVDDRNPKHCLGGDTNRMPQLGRQVALLYANLFAPLMSNMYYTDTDSQFLNRNNMLSLFVFVMSYDIRSPVIPVFVQSDFFQDLTLNRFTNDETAS